MAIALKEFSQFIMEFINSNFIPLLNSSINSHQKCIEQWKRVSELIRNIETATLWQFQNNLVCKPSPPPTPQAKQPIRMKKVQSNRPSMNSFGGYDNILDKKEPHSQVFVLQDQIKLSTNSKPHQKQQSSQPRNKSYKYSGGNEDYEAKLSFEPRMVRDKSEIVDDDGFNSLILSFQKLCVNFENNHKKLLKEDKNLKENIKMEVGNH